MSACPRNSVMQFKEIAPKDKSGKSFVFIRKKSARVTILSSSFTPENFPTGTENDKSYSSWQKPGWKPNWVSKLLSWPLRGLILVYKYGFSGLFPPSCRYTPTCSSYGLEAVKKYGAWRGGILAVRRILRCHPGSPGGYDPVP